MRDESGNKPSDPFAAQRPLEHVAIPPRAVDPPYAGLQAVPASPVAVAENKAETALPPQQEQKDAFREIVETVVFVVVLVLLLKAFMAEAFVIPTGSMATTLYGYHRIVECPECLFRFPLNMSKQDDPQEAQRAEILGCTCPNCGLQIDRTNSNDFRPKTQ
jgi:hypothetical protein